MDNQRLRNLTTGKLHTQMADIYVDMENLFGEAGVMTHQLPRALKAIIPFLKDKVTDPRFWDGQYNPDHTGDTYIPVPTEAERKAMWTLYMNPTGE